jgi:hypothetical protein
VRLRSVLVSGVVLVAVIAAVVLLRAHPAPSSPDAALPEPTTSPTPPPVVDARSARLTSAFLHTTTLPAGYRFAEDQGNHAAFRFERYSDPQPGLRPAQYSATGSLVRADDVTLDRVSVTVAQVARNGLQQQYGDCEAGGNHDGSSCTERILQDGTHAKVVRNAVFAQSVASDVTTGARPGIQTQLDAVFGNGTLLIVTVAADNGAGIPLDDAAMLRLATIPGVAS